MYIPKINIHNRNTIYIFLGALDGVYPEIVKKIISNTSLVKSDEDILEKKLGKHWGKVIMINEPNVVYLPNLIKPEDTVNIFRKKVCLALGIKKTSDIYVWYERQIKNDPAVIYNFINNIFKKSQTLKTDIFKEYVVSYFGGVSIPAQTSLVLNKKEAIRILFNSNISKIKESLCFQYAFDGYQEYFNADPSNPDQNLKDTSSLYLSTSLPLLLNNFSVKNDMFHVIERSPSFPKIYFPFDEHPLTASDQKLVNAVENTEKAIDSIIVPDDISTNTILNYVSIKGTNLGINGKVNMDSLFNSLEASQQVPFIKYKTPLNVFYKIHKKSLPAISQEDIANWTKIPSNKDDKSYITIKQVFNASSYCSISLNMDLSYSVKINISIKDGEGVKSVEKFLPHINKIIDQIAKLYPQSYVPLIPSSILRDSKESDIVHVEQLITSSTVQTKSINVNYSNLTNAITSHMYPYFNIIENSDKNILHLQYKKVNNYTKFTNISSFISGHYMLPREELIRQLELMFMVSSTEAEQEIDSWFSEHTMELEINKTKLYVKPKHDNFVNVKIRLKNVVDFKYMVNGITNMGISDEISSLLHKLIVLSSKSSKKSPGIDLEAIEKLNIIDKGVVKDISTDVLDDSSSESGSDQDSESGSNSEEDEDMKALLLGFEKELSELEKNKQQPPPNLSPVKVDKKPTKKIKGYVLNKLYEADMSLFDYDVPPDVKRRDYASVCGWVDRRQPVVVSEAELENINKNYPGAINGHVKSGSTAELQKKNNYICPKIWCPVSRVALSYEDYVKHGEKCPFPDIQEEPILFATKSFFGEGETGLKKERYPGFLDKSIHPDKLCLPCCFKVKPDKGNRNKKRGDQCVPKELEANTKVEDDIAIGKEKYILGTNSFPLENGRYGLLPIQLVDWFQQGDKQGNRHDGTGSMTDATNAFFRRGVSLSKQSYGEALIAVLDNPGIQTSQQLFQVIHDNIDVITYISLENGRIMKMFIDTTKTVYDKESFSKFYEWFKTQKKYILHMNLTRLLTEIEEAGRTFDVNKLQHHHEVLREYIIYQSFMNFKEYLKNDRIAKEHLVLSDLIGNHLYKHVNVHRYNIVQLEYNADNEKIYFQCNVNKEKAYDLNYPFVFLLKRHVFYEPLVHVQLVSGSLVATTNFSNSSHPSLKKIIMFVTKNCISNKTQYPLRNLMNFLKGIDYKVKYIVLDYGYKTCGLILNQNLYLPLHTREDIYYDENVRYIYLSDVPRFKCLLGKEDVLRVYSSVGNFLKQKYNITEFVEEKGKLIGFKLGDGLFVPMNVTLSSKYAVTFKDGLFILISHEKMDRRKEIYQSFTKDNEFLSSIVKELISKMDTDNDLRKEMEFLLDKNNPLPIIYKKAKLIEALEKTGIAIGDVKDRELIIYRLFTALTTRNGTLYQQRTRRFVFSDDELFLDHFDVLAGRLKEEIDFAENPHKAFLNIVDDIEHTYIFDEGSDVSYNDIILPDMFEDVPTKWRKILKGFNIIGTDKIYNQKYIYNVFSRISKDIQGGNGFTDDIYYVNYKNKIVSSFASGNTSEILSNPWLENYFKKKKVVPTLDRVLEVYESVFYYPSLFDIRIMAQLAGINLVLIGRKTLKNPDGLEVLYNNSDFYIILLYSYDRHNVFDVFNLFCSSSNKIYFRAGELPAEFKEILTKKMKTYNVEIIDEDD